MRKKAISFLSNAYVRIIISLLILVGLFVWLPFDELKESLSNISLGAWLLIFAGYITGHLIGVLKWNLMIGLDGHDMPFWIAVRCYFAGLFANLFLPSLAGGDIVKTGLAISYKKEKGVPIFGTVIDRVIDTASVVFIILIAAMLSPKFLEPSDQNVLYLFISTIFIFFLLALLLLVIPVHKFSEGKIRSMMSRIRCLVKLVIKKPARPALCFILSLIIQSFFILLTVYLANVIGIVLPLVIWFLIWPLAKLTALLPVSLGGIGVREVALAVLLGRVAISVTDSVALGLLWNSLLISGSLIGGLLYIGLKFLPSKEMPTIGTILQTNQKKEIQ